MAKIVSTKTTRKKVKDWLHKLCVPRKALGGNPICPFLAQHMQNIHIAVHPDPERLANNFADVKDIFKFEACVILGFDMSYEKMEKMTDRINKSIAPKNAVALMMHPDGTDSVLPVEYQFDLPVLIVQKLDRLKQARQQLKSTNYYKHYK
jgi:hypothetical protein